MIINKYHIVNTLSGLSLGKVTEIVPSGMNEDENMFAGGRYLKDKDMLFVEFGCRGWAEDWMQRAKEVQGLHFSQWDSCLKMWCSSVHFISSKFDVTTMCKYH